MNGKVAHVFHVWMNSEDPIGGSAPTEMPIKAHEHGLYDFKSAMQTLPWLAKAIGQERRKELPLVHQQCSHSQPEALEENHLECGLGQRLDSCPILKRMRSIFDRERSKTYPDGRASYYADITDEQIDEAAANVCVWHMLMGSPGGFVDWNEGAVQDVSDRKFWSTVYEHMSMDPEEMPPPH